MKISFPQVTSTSLVMMDHEDALRQVSLEAKRPVLITCCKCFFVEIFKYSPSCHGGRTWLWIGSFVLLQVLASVPDPFQRLKLLDSTRLTLYFFVDFYQHPNVPNSENTEYILRPPKPMPYSEHQARKAMINKEENMEPPLRKPRAGTLPSSVPTTPTKKVPTEMPPPLAPITPRARKTPARGNDL